MKILMISHEYPPIGGGGANACSYLGREFARRENEVTLVTVWYPGLLEEETTNEGMKIYRLKAKRKHKEHCSFPEMGDFVIKALSFAGQLCRKQSYDVCLIFFGIPSGPVGLYLKWRFNLKYIVRFGGGDIPGFQDRFKIIYKLIGPFVKLIWKNASALVANSSGLKDFAENFCDKYPVSVVPNGVDTSIYMPAEKQQSDRVELIFVSRLIERKGLQFLIPYLKDIEKKTNREIHLTIVGDGPYRNTLEQLARDNDTFDMIEFWGQKDKSELPALYQRGDIFVFPSKREGMPNAVLEAMASGLPIVMAPCEGAAELVDGNGIIAYNDFCGKIVELINSGEMENMGRMSRKRASELFSWESVASQYLHLMEGM